MSSSESGNLGSITHIAVGHDGPICHIGAVPPRHEGLVAIWRRLSAVEDDESREYNHAKFALIKEWTADGRVVARQDRSGAAVVTVRRFGYERFDSRPTLAERSGRRLMIAM